MTGLLALMLTAAPAPWTAVKANGFTFEMPSAPALTTEPMTWPTTGQMTVTKWTSALKTGDQQLDVFSCFQSTVETPRLMGLMHDVYCKADGTTYRYDRTDPKTQAHECLWLGPGPDGKQRRTMAKIVTVGPNVCVLTSSARSDAAAEAPSEGMRRFVDSLKLTGKQTVLAANTPWVTVTCPGCTFLLPAAATPESRVEGKTKATVWKQKAGDEEFGVRCTDGQETVDQVVKLTMNFAQAHGATQQKLPGGAVEIAMPGSLTRVTPQPKGKRVCMINAYSTGEPRELSTDARRFVESFAWTK